MCVHAHRYSSLSFSTPVQSVLLAALVCKTPRDEQACLHKIEQQDCTGMHHEHKYHESIWQLCSFGHWKRKD